MRFYHLLTLLIATSLFPACDLRQPVEPVDITTHTVTLPACFTADDLTPEPLSSPTLASIPLSCTSGRTGLSCVVSPRPGGYRRRGIRAPG